MVMETAAPPLVTSDSDFYSTTAELKTNASKNNTDDYEPLTPGEIVYISIIFSIEIPIICLAIYAVYSLLKSKQAAPVFVINLLAADLIQIVSMLLFTIPSRSFRPFSIKVILWAGFMGMYFMTCIAVERYILIAHPIWHRSHRSLKCFVYTSLTGWLVSLIILPIILMNVVEIFFLPFFSMQ